MMKKSNFMKYAIALPICAFLGTALSLMQVGVNYPGLAFIGSAILSILLFGCFVMYTVGMDYE